MKKLVVRSLSLVVLLCAVCALAACKTTPKGTPKTTGIEIASPPDKVVYLEGEFFNDTGMVVKKILDDGNKEAVTGYTYDKTGALALSDTTVVVSYGEFTANVAITVSARQPETPQVKELQVLSLPDKTTYLDGEKFDKTGMEIVYVTESGERVAVTDYTVDKTTLSVGDTFVTVSYGGKTVKVNVTVNANKPAREVTGVEIYEGDDLKYTRTMDVSSIIKYKAVYSDGTKDADWTFASAEDLDGYKMENGKLVLSLSLFVKNKEFKKSVEVPVDETSLSVSELLTKTPDDGNVYQVEGIVVSVISVMAREEYLIKDTQSSVFIGVTNLPSDGYVTSMTKDAQYSRGDKISIPVKLVKDEIKANYSDSGKVHAQYAGGAIYETGIVQSGIQLEYDYSAATAMSSQADLQNFLSAENRAANQYKLVKLNGPLKIIRYGDGPNYHYRFFFNDVSSNSLAAQKVDGSSPCFMYANQHYLTQKTVGELLADNANWAPTVWANPGVAYKNVTALFVGGNGFYHEFIILEDDAVSDMPKSITSVTATAPDKNVYTTEDETLNLEGAELTVKYNYGADATVAITMDMLDNTTVPNMNTAGEFIVKGTYQGFEFQFTVSVTEEVAQEISLKGTPRLEYNLGENFAAVESELCKLTLNVKLTTGASKEVAITENMVGFGEGDWTVGKHEVTISYLGAKTTVEITVVVPDVSVTQIKAYDAGASVYNLTGVVVTSAFISGTIDAPLNGEIMLKDTKNSNIIGLKGLVTKDNKLGGLAVGDEIKVQVTLGVTSTTATHSEYGKIAATIVPETQPAVLSKNNEVKLDLSTAVELNSQADIKEFLKDAATRAGNAYKLVKLNKSAHLTNYSGSLYVSYEGTKTADIKVNGLSPFVHIMNEAMTLGEQKYVDLLFGGAPETNTLTSPAQLVGDVYLLYIGGQGTFYHQFILLGADYVVQAEAQ